MPLIFSAFCMADRRYRATTSTTWAAAMRLYARAGCGLVVGAYCAQYAGAPRPDDQRLGRPSALAVCPARLTTRHSVVAHGKSWSNFVVVTILLVDSKVGIVDYWSAKEWREFCHPSRANEAPPASQPAQHLSGSFQLNEAHVRRFCGSAIWHRILLRRSPKVASPDA